MTQRSNLRPLNGESTTLRKRQPCLLVIDDGEARLNGHADHAAPFWNQPQFFTHLP